jgi:hypothetical protein
MGKAMKQVFRFIVGLLLVVGWLLAILSLHLVQTPDDIPTLITKDRLGFTDTYVDTRHWTPDDLAAHLTLVDRLEKAHKLELLNHVFKQQPGIEPHVQVMAARAKAPKTQTPSTSSQPAQQAARVLFSLF